MGTPLTIIPTQYIHLTETPKVQYQPIATFDLLKMPSHCVRIHQDKANDFLQLYRSISYTG